MKELTTDLKVLQDETLNNLKNSKATNTLRAYKSDYRDFSLFCVRHGLKSMPSDPKVVSLYLTNLNKLGIKRSKGSIQRGKKPILINHLKQIIEVINKEKLPEIKKIRDKSLILIGFSGGFRRSEIIAIDYEDIEFVDEGMKILVRKSKTDQFGEGHLKGIPYFSDQSLCPVELLKKFLEISKIKSGAIFRKFNKGFSLSNSRLTDQSVALLIKKYLSKAGFDSASYSGHSLRSGFATVTAEAGSDERSIMAMTGHKTTQMVRRYIREANIFKNNALNKVKL
jgi:site-specific recombinase XerD